MNPKTIIGIIFISLLGFLIIGSVLIVKQTKRDGNRQVINQEVYSCNDKSDCVIVRSSACNACPIVINKKYAEYWNKKSDAKHNCGNIKTDCIGPREYVSAQCLDNKCSALLVDKTKLPCASDSDCAASYTCKDRKCVRDKDVGSNNWNYIKIALELYREPYYQNITY